MSLPVMGGGGRNSEKAQELTFPASLERMESLVKIISSCSCPLKLWSKITLTIVTQTQRTTASFRLWFSTQLEDKPILSCIPKDPAPQYLDLKWRGFYSLHGESEEDVIFTSGRAVKSPISPRPQQSSLICVFLHLLPFSPTLWPLFQNIHPQFPRHNSALPSASTPTQGVFQACPVSFPQLLTGLKACSLPGQIVPEKILRFSLLFPQQLLSS